MVKLANLRVYYRCILNYALFAITHLYRINTGCLNYKRKRLTNHLFGLGLD